MKKVFFIDFISSIFAPDKYSIFLILKSQRLFQAKNLFCSQIFILIEIGILVLVNKMKLKPVYVRLK